MRVLSLLALGLFLGGCPGEKEDTGPFDADGDGFTGLEDCNDDDGLIFPGADELCDGVDNNCDDVIDEGTAVDVTAWYVDGDGDGYGDSAGEAALACEAGTGQVADNTDCDDANGDVNPGATEVCDDADIDEDCDGNADDADTEGAEGKTTVYPDVDGDTFGDSSDAGTDYCDPPADSVTDNTDCDDAHASAFPGGTEICDDDDVDEDCDGYADDTDPIESDGSGGAAGKSTVWPDGDGDGVGDSDEATSDFCDVPATGWAAVDGDCNDEDGEIGAGSYYYEDCDWDGFGGNYDYDEDGDYVADIVCADPGESSFGCDWVPTSGDCADPYSGDPEHADGMIYPGAPAACDGECNDCDAWTDDDGDGYLEACTLVDAEGESYEGETEGEGTDDDGDGFAACNDCDDGDNYTFPGAAWLDDADACMTDWDEDGWGEEVPALGVEAGTDCDDADSDAGGPDAWYADSDGDGYGDPASTVVHSCDEPEGSYSTTNDDCNDDFDYIHPNAVPDCGQDASDTSAWADYDCDGTNDYEDDQCVANADTSFGGVNYYLYDLRTYDSTGAMDENGRRTYDEAIVLCDALEAADEEGDWFVAEPNSASENDWLLSLVTLRGDNPWLGATDSASEGNWTWASSGETFYTDAGGTTTGSYSNWGSGEPNNASEEDCGNIVSSDVSGFLAGEWIDVDCTAQWQTICEYSPPEPPAQLWDTCSDAQEGTAFSGAGDWTMSGDFISYSNEMTSECSEVDTSSAADGADAIAVVELADGESLTVDFAAYDSSGYDNNVSIYLLNDCSDTSTCVTGVNDAYYGSETLVQSNTSGAMVTYYLVVDTDDGYDSYTYDLELTIGAPPLAAPELSNTCAEATAAAGFSGVGEWSVSGDFTSYTNDMTSDCAEADPALVDAGQDALITVELADGETLTSTFGAYDSWGYNNNVSIYLVEDCADTSTCVVGVNAATWAAETLSYTNDSGATSTLTMVLDSNDDYSCYDYDLDVTIE